MLSKRCFRWLLLVVATAMPLVANLTCAIPRLALCNFTDSVFYLSYARQFSELVLRHGFLYYSTRFGGILPEALSGHLFGEIAGICILRGCLSALVSLALFETFRRRYGVLSGLVASALWAFNPAALRLACTTYVDSTATPFLILGCCLAAIYPASTGAMFVSGILFGLATSAHLYAAIALVLLIPWLVGVSWGRGLQVSAREMGWMAAGFGLSWLLGWLWYAVVWGMPGLLSPTIDLMRDLDNGQAALWKKPVALALHETPAWFAPVLLLPLCCIAAWKGSPLMRGASCSLFTSTVFFWGGDLFGKAYVLSMPFYYSFLLPVTVLSAASGCGELVLRQTSRTSRLVVAGLLASASMIPTFLARFEMVGWVSYAIFSGEAVVLVLIWKRLSCNWLVMAGVSLFFLASLAVAWTGMFSQMLGHYPAEDQPVLEIASRLRKIVPSALSDQGVTRFWYNDDPGKPGASDRRMIGSFWLHYFGRLTGQGGCYVPFGALDDPSVESISENGPERIIIFDQDPIQVVGAISEINAKGLPYKVSRQEELVAASDSRRVLNVAVMERSISSLGKKPTSKFMWHQVHRGRVLSSDGRSTEFLSSRIKWWDPFAESDLGFLHKGDRIVIPYTIRSGRIRFDMEEKGNNKSKVSPLVTVEKWQSDHGSILEMTVPEDMNHAVVSLRNRYPTGAASQIRVGDISVFKAR